MSDCYLSNLKIKSTKRQLLINRLWASIGSSCLSNTFFERDFISKKLIKHLLNDFKIQNYEYVISQIIYSLIIGPTHCSNYKHQQSLCAKYEENKEILSVDLEWQQDQLFDNSDDILFGCLYDENDPNDDDINDDDDGDNKTKSEQEAIECLIDYIINDSDLKLNWEFVWKYFDNPNLNYFDNESIIKLTKISVDYESIPPFLKTIIHGTGEPFSNNIGYFNIISNSLQCTSIHCDTNENKKLLISDHESTWNSLDLYDNLLSLSNSNLYSLIRNLLKLGIDSSPDIIIYGIVCSKIESSLKDEILLQILPSYFNSNNFEIKLNQFSILCHSDQYLFCKYIRQNYEKVIEISNILSNLDIHPIRILTNYISLHNNNNYDCSILSYPILLSMCLYSRNVLNDYYINWFLTNSLKICSKFYNALIDFIITDQYKYYDLSDNDSNEQKLNFIKLTFIQLFKYKKYLKQTQIVFLKFLLNNFKILSILNISNDNNNKFEIFYKLIEPNADNKKINQTLNTIDNLFKNKQLNEFEFAIILLIAYQKIFKFQDKDDILLKFITNNQSINEYLINKWTNYCKYINKITNNKFGKDIDSNNNNNNSNNNDDPFPLVDIIKISQITIKTNNNHHNILINSNNPNNYYYYNNNQNILPIINNNNFLMNGNNNLQQSPSRFAVNHQQQTETKQSQQHIENENDKQKRGEINDKSKTKSMAEIKHKKSSKHDKKEKISSSSSPSSPVSEKEKKKKMIREIKDKKSSKDRDRKKRKSSSKDGKHHHRDIRKSSHGISMEQPSKGTIENINLMMSDLTKLKKEELSDRFLKIKDTLEPYSIPTLSWFSRLLVHRCSTDFEFQTVYIDLLQQICHRQLWKHVINITYEAIQSLLTSSTIDEQSQQRMILRGLGSWIGKLTIGRTKPLLQKKLNLTKLIVSAYEENRLIVVVPFVSKILESTIGNTIFCPPNPWLMSILKLIAELRIYVEKFPEQLLPVKYEIEQLFQHLNISPKLIEPTNIIRQRMKLKQHKNYIDFKTQKTRIPNLVQYVKISPEIENIIKSEKYDITNFQHIIAHGFDRCVCEIVPVCVERSIDVACICSRELVLKDTICEMSSDAIRKCANQMVSTLSGALTLVICREPIKISAQQQIKKCLKDAGYAALLPPPPPNQQNSNSTTTTTKSNNNHNNDDNSLTAYNQKLTDQEKEINSIIISIVDRNLDLVCNMAEKLAADRATKILEHNLGSLFSSRNGKTHPIPYNKNNIRMQRRVYEDFDTIRHMLRASCRDGFTEWNLIYQKFLEKFTKLEHSYNNNNNNNNDDNKNNDNRIENNQQHILMNEIADLLKSLLADNNDKKQDGFSFIFNKIHSFENNKNLREAVFMILTMVRDRNKLFIKEFTKQWLIQNNSDLNRILNETILLGLLDYNLIVLDDIDKFISSLIKTVNNKADNDLSIKIGISVIRSFVLGRKFSLTDFKLIHSSLQTKLNESQSVQQLFTELNNIKPSHHYGHYHHSNNNQLSSSSHHGSSSQKGRYINYQTRVIDLLRKSFSIKGAHTNKIYTDFINNEMAQFLTNQQSIQKFLEVSIRIVIGKCTEDLKNPAFGQDLKDVIDAFGKLVVSCIKRIDLTVPTKKKKSDKNDKNNNNNNNNKIEHYLMMQTFFNCIQHDIMNRIKTKPANLFNQRPYLRLIVFVLFELSEITFMANYIYPSILRIFAKFLRAMRPQKCPQFIFAWMQLLSHSKFMPKILKITNQKDNNSMNNNLNEDEKEKEQKQNENDGNKANKESKGKKEIERKEDLNDDLHDVDVIMNESKIMFHDLLMNLLQFVDPFWRSPKSPPSVCLLFQGTLRILLVLLHDFPSFLCEFHFSFCENIPISSFQMRNLVLSAFPKNTQLPDPFQPNLNLQTIPEMEHEPKISSNYMKNLSSAKNIIDHYLNGNNDDDIKSIASLLKQSKKNKRSNNKQQQQQQTNGFVIQYNLSLINSVVLYLASRPTNLDNKCLELIYYLALELDCEGRYHLFNGVCNNLRYPNSHTKFCSEAILNMFKKSNRMIKEQITRILLERLVVHRPHPWGLLITFIQLIKQPEYKFWDEPFTRCSAEIESLFQTVASSCFRVFN